MFYDNDRKRPWRGWAWNQIVGRLSVPIGESLVLYLCGPDPLDYIKAHDKGFRKHNLLAVSDNLQHVDAMRAAGLYAIQTHNLDLGGLLLAWPDDFRIDAVLCDFTGVIDRSFLADMSSVGAAAGATFVLNYQRRGKRESPAGDAFNRELRAHHGKHRGRHAAATWYALWRRQLGGDERLFLAYEELLASPPVSAVFNTAPSSNPRSNVKFDSVAFTLPAALSGMQHKNPKRQRLYRSRIAAFRAVNRGLAGVRSNAS